MDKQFVIPTRQIDLNINQTSAERLKEQPYNPFNTTRLTNLKLTAVSNSANKIANTNKKKNRGHNYNQSAQISKQLPNTSLRGRVSSRDREEALS